MRLTTAIIATIGGVALFGAVIASAAPKKGAVPQARTGFDAEIARHAQRMLEEGKQTFRYDTFGSEAFWGDALQLHTAIAGSKHGGAALVSRQKPLCRLASRLMRMRCQPL